MTDFNMAFNADTLPAIYNEGMVSQINDVLTNMRGSGRTSAIIHSLRAGDNVICADSKQALLLERAVWSLGIEGIRIFTAKNFSDAEYELAGWRPVKRLVVDHGFLDRAYINAVVSVNKDWLALKSLTECR